MTKREAVRGWRKKWSNVYSERTRTFSETVLGIVDGSSFISSLSKWNSLQKLLRSFVNRSYGLDSCLSYLMGGLKWNVQYCKVKARIRTKPRYQHFRKLWQLKAQFVILLCLQVMCIHKRNVMGVYIAVFESAWWFQMRPLQVLRILSLLKSGQYSFLLLEDVCCIHSELANRMELFEIMFCLSE